MNDLLCVCEYDHNIVNDGARLDVPCERFYSTAVTAVCDIFSARCC